MTPQPTHTETTAPSKCAWFVMDPTVFFKPDSTEWDDRKLIDLLTRSTQVALLVLPLPTTSLTDLHWPTLLEALRDYGRATQTSIILNWHKVVTQNGSGEKWTTLTTIVLPADYPKHDLSVIITTREYFEAVTMWDPWQRLLQKELGLTSHDGHYSADLETVFGDGVSHDEQRSGFQAITVVRKDAGGQPVFLYFSPQDRARQ